MRNLSKVILLALFIAGCANSPMQRRQLMLYSDQDMVQRGEQSYLQMQQQLPVSLSVRQTAYVNCVSNYIVAALDQEQRGALAWEVTLFEGEQANAFALPGGKMGVYSGLMDVATNQHQLAAVMAHEVGHVLANHSNERASRSTLRNIGLAAVQLLGVSSTTLNAIELGSQLGLSLPFSRLQESEADSIGVMLMAKAGFDPVESIRLWQNMSAQGGSSPPELLSTHPSAGSRMNNLADLIPAAKAVQDSARSRGAIPDCRVN